MLETVFKGVFDNGLDSSVKLPEFILCIVVSVIIGLIIALTFTYKNRYTKSFAVTLAMLPAVVCVVIMMVNGNIGTGIAVAGAFSLIRFRSVPGTAKEISTIFAAMGAGLIAGVGYLGYAVLFTVVICIFMFILNLTGFGEMKQDNELILKVTIPENLNYTHGFDDIMEKYTSKCQLFSVKSTNMGSMFKLHYNIILKNIDDEKEFLDAIRTRNGNLEIVISRQEAGINEL